MPEGYFKIERKVYKGYLDQCQYGDISYVRLPDTESNIIFFGPNSNEKFELKNLYKALNMIKPDCVLM